MAYGTRRIGVLLSGAAALAVLGGAGCGAPSAAPGAAGAVTPSAQAATTGGQAASGPAEPAVAASPAVATLPSGAARPSGQPATVASPGGTMSPASVPASSPHPTAAAPRTASTRPAASAPASTPASAPASQGGTAAAQVLGLINQARATAGLPALTVTSGLNASASAHNQVMAGGCGLSHQCPGEAALGDRETAAGVQWTSAGENIGEGGPVDNTSAAIAQMATGLTQSMLDEKPPDDGHRMNILSTSYTHVGIAVYRDGSGTVWLTQDFSN